MYKITILTLFPESVQWLENYSIIKNAIKNKLVEIEIINFRNWSKDKHKKVDDYQFGGGPGMVLQLQPIVDCLKAICTNNTKIYLLTPSGKVFNQFLAKQLVHNTTHIVLVCGHYEGFDHRLYHYVDGEISIGDYILSGGEIPALVVADSLIRLLDGAINQASLESESFEHHLLDYPVYTKPASYDGHDVPPILLSGNHAKIESFRYDQQIALTKLKRPDLYKKYLKVRKDKENGSYTN